MKTWREEIEQRTKEKIRHFKSDFLTEKILDSPMNAHFGISSMDGSFIIWTSNFVCESAIDDACFDYLVVLPRNPE